MPQELPKLPKSQRRGSSCYPAEDVTGASEIPKARILLRTQLKMSQELQKSQRQGSSSEPVNWDFESSFSGSLSGKGKVPDVRVCLPSPFACEGSSFRLFWIFNPSTSPTCLVTGISNPESILKVHIESTIHAWKLQKQSGQNRMHKKQRIHKHRSERSEKGNRSSGVVNS
jgi:hypothetical protein